MRIAASLSNGRVCCRRGSGEENLNDQRKGVARATMRWLQRGSVRWFCAPRYVSLMNRMNSEIGGEGRSLQRGRACKKVRRGGYSKQMFNAYVIQVIHVFHASVNQVPPRCHTSQRQNGIVVCNRIIYGDNQRIITQTNCSSPPPECTI